MENYYYDYYNMYYDSDNYTGNWTYDPTERNPYRVEQIVFEAFLLLLILAGNVAVLAVIIVEGQKSRMHFFIKNLAVADLFCGVFYVVPRIVLQINDERFYGGDILCKLQEFLSNIGIYGSNMIMIALSIDRLYILLRPLATFATRGRNPTMIVSLCWVAALLVSVVGPCVFTYHERYQECALNLNGSEIKIYFTVLFVFVFVIPTIIIAGCYSMIAFIIWNVSNKTEGFQLTEISSPSAQQSTLLTSRQNTSSSSSGVGQRNSSSTLSDAKMRTIKMTFMISVAFMCCWAPFMIFNLLDVYEHTTPSKEMNSIRIFIQSLLPLNSVANPLIYGAFSIRVCRQFRKKISRRFSTSRRTDNIFI
ncbi:mesotocin receptor-like [Ostrea edulis]|uniref:mesotocin receptor-like n=1 Tax=Ostrea edulis TaxID=37623 RepID=UPI00209546EB|nr:mesotocin receptor-like [Ostrea edulis]